MSPLSRHEARERLAKLRKLVNHYREQYHVHDRSLIPDAALDQLKNEIADLETQYPDLITPDSPTQRVAGRPLGKFKKVRHRQPVLSLQDVFSPEEFLQYEQRTVKLLPKNTALDYFCELKIDGLTVVLTYRDGILVTGATRGDGSVGEDVTQNLKTIEAIPLTLNLDWLKRKRKTLPSVIEVRGEIYLSKKEFERINREQEKNGGKLYANPRNTAAGSLRQLDSSITARRKLNLFAFDLITDLGQQTHQQEHDYLKKMGFPVNPHNAYAKDAAGVIRFLEKWEEKRKKLDYQTDGAVIVINKTAFEKELGSIGKAERWMVAYKFAAEEATTVVEDITVSVGRTGTLTPVAQLRPVAIAGSTVSRATLHNEDQIARLDVRIGDTVIIHKAGDIIPEVIKVLTELRSGKEKKFTMPRKCPICDHVVVREEGAAAWRCTNRACYARDRERILHFVSKGAFDIPGLGPAIIEQLLDQDLIADSADLFSLKKGDVAQLPRLGEKSAENIVSAIQSHREITFDRFLNALGIPLVGEETAADLANVVVKEAHFAKGNPLKNAVGALRAMTLEELAHIEGIGPKVAQQIVASLSEPRYQLVIDKLIAAGIVLRKPPRTVKKSKVAGKTFVLTGSLATLTRAQAKAKIKRAGGNVASAVSKSTDYVVAGTDPGSKFTKAQDLGVAIIDEEALKRMLA